MTTEPTLTVEQIAAVCHEANRALCEAHGDRSQMPWADAQGWQQANAVESVRYRLAHPKVDVALSHNHWVEQRRGEGWRYGATKEFPTHPSMMVFDQLPPLQKAKGRLFAAIVNSLGDARAKTTA